MVPRALLDGLVAELRAQKTKRRLSKTLEICVLPHRVGADGRRAPGQYAGIYIFATPARLVRPVRNLSLGGEIEWLGILEQVYTAVALDDVDSAPSGTH